MPQKHAQHIGKILDHAFHTYRANFWPITRTVAVVFVPYTAINGLFSSIRFWDIVQNIVINPIIMSAITVGTIAIEQGESWSLEQVYRQALSRSLVVLASMIMIGMALILPIAAILIGNTAFENLPYFAAGISHLAVFLIAGGIMIRFIIKYAVTMPVIFAEGQRAPASLKRSWALTSNHFWQCLSITLSIVIFNVLLNIILPHILTILWFATFSLWPNLEIIHILTPLLKMPGQFLILSLQPIMMLYLYYDLRIRNEGYDFELAVQAAGFPQVELENTPNNPS